MYMQRLEINFLQLIYYALRVGSLSDDARLMSDVCRIHQA